LRALGKIANAIRSAVNTLKTYKNKITNAVMGFVDSVMDIADAVVTGLNDITSGLSSLLNMPRSIVGEVTQLINSAFDAASNLVISLPTDFIDSLTSMKQQFDNVGALPSLFAKRWSDQWAASLSRFSGLEESGLTSPSLASNSYSLVQSLPDETVWQLASRISGDANRAYDIIAANHLVFPYFVSSQKEKKPGTLAPGDPVLVPVIGSSSSSGIAGGFDYSSPTATESGVIESASAVALTRVSNSCPWRFNQWVGYSVEVLDGVGVGQTRVISGNGTNILYVDAWDVVPAQDSLFRIFYKGIVPTADDAPGSSGS
jgi:hypothetical protein